MQLPFAVGQSWLTHGPHSDGGVVGQTENALDFAGGDGHVRAAADGTVRIVQCSGGPFVMIDHAGNFHTGYYHIQNIQVTNGQVVSAGTWLGDTGTATPCGGSATGNHVHYSLWQYGGATRSYPKKSTAYAVDGVSMGGWTFHADPSGTQCDQTNSPCGSATRDSDGTTVSLPVNLYNYGTSQTPTAKAPSVSSLSPSSGPSNGGTAVTVSGADFKGTTSVRFGSTNVAFTVVSGNQITATSPGGSGTVDVTVTTSVGTSGIVAGDKFTYVSPTMAPTVTSGTAGFRTDATSTTPCPAATVGGDSVWLVESVDGQSPASAQPFNPNDGFTPPGGALYWYVMSSETGGSHQIVISCTQATDGNSALTAPSTLTYAPFTLTVTAPRFAASTSAGSVARGQQVTVSTTCPSGEAQYAGAYFRFSGNYGTSYYWSSTNTETATGAGGTWSSIVTIPADAPTGAATVYVDCGAGSHPNATDAPSEGVGFTVT